MREQRSRGLWIAAAVCSVLTIAAIVVDPADFRRHSAPDQLESAIEKAATYYEFEHYDRAAETYAEAVDLGMESGVEWYRYARALDLSDQLDLEQYVTAYQLLLRQSPDNELVDEVESILTNHAVAFSYTGAVEGSMAEGTLVVVSGTVNRIRHGRIESGTDALFVDTKPDRWFGFMGDSVRIVAPKHLKLQSGETITAIGWYDGLASISDDAGLTHSYPCVIAAGVTPYEKPEP